jgi:hypothetical protein
MMDMTMRNRMDAFKKGALTIIVSGSSPANVKVFLGKEAVGLIQKLECYWDSNKMLSEYTIKIPLIHSAKTKIPRITKNDIVIVHSNAIQDKNPLNLPGQVMVYRGKEQLAMIGKIKLVVDFEKPKNDFIISYGKIVKENFSYVLTKLDGLSWIDIETI